MTLDYFTQDREYQNIRQKINEQNKKIKYRKELIEDVKKRRSQGSVNNLTDDDFEKIKNKVIQSNDKLNKMQHRVFGKRGIEIPTKEFLEDKKEK